VCDDHNMLVTIRRLVVYCSFNAHHIVHINDVLGLGVLRVFDRNKSHSVKGFRWSEPTSYSLLPAVIDALQLVKEGSSNVSA
jgi:hypothetical protein